MACLVVMEKMGEKAPGERRGIQVHQDLQDEQGGLDQLVPLGRKETVALLGNLDQRETLDHLGLQVSLVQLEERAPQGGRGARDLQAHQAPKENLGPKEEWVPQACRAPQVSKEREVHPGRLEPLDVLGQQGLLEP
ncbi:hypothetical protein R6Z07F_019304 [Ovis aries]